MKERERWSVPTPTAPTHTHLVEPIGVVCDLVGSVDLQDHAGDQLLGYLHQVVVVRVRPVKLAGGELRIVGQIDA